MQAVRAKTVALASLMSSTDFGKTHRKSTARFGGVSRSYGNTPWQQMDQQDAREPLEERRVVYGRSLIFQMMLYYNVWYSLCFAVLAWWAYSHKIEAYDIAWKHRMWYGLIMGLWTSFELSRLLCGLFGNLKSSVQHLILFFVFSFLNLGLNAVFYAVDKGLPRKSYDRALSTVHFMFIIPELIACYYEVGRQIKFHTVKFYLNLSEAELPEGPDLDSGFHSVTL
eukprot:TRINITY_DN8204_c0_g15_i1.p1 TRINITY_DN8204_c0_g15~~TRINITY_DN8204_c0_g15_i1.p1  ORF type:complete len:225 (+),score=85.33 TRINITY_DN8204_c0_g15_i1:107-781(+)